LHYLIDLGVDTLLVAGAASETCGDGGRRAF
jgi:hypothetical protein